MEVPVPGTYPPVDFDLRVPGGVGGFEGAGLAGGKPVELGPTLKLSRPRPVMWKRRTHAGQTTQAAKVGKFVG